MLKYVSQMLFAFAIMGITIGTLHASDIEDGKKVFKKCKSCHVLAKDGVSKLGPNLWGVIGRDVGSMEGFKYSSAMKNYGGQWSSERLNNFLTKPKAEIKGTKMSFPGLKKEVDRINLITYLNSMSDEPQELVADSQTENSEETSEIDYGVLYPAAGVEETYAYCTACHSERIVSQQGLVKADWIELLEWMADEQGMNVIDEPDYSMIINYLSEHYGTDRPNFPY